MQFMRLGAETDNLIHLRHDTWIRHHSKDSQYGQRAI